MSNDVLLWSGDLYIWSWSHYGLPWWLSGKESACNAEDLVQSLSRTRLSDKGMATPSSILAWEIPWTEEPGGLQFIWSHKVGRDWVTNTYNDLGLLLAQSS